MYFIRNKDAVHTKWVQSWLALLNDLQAYVKEYHTTGVSWNSRGSPFDASRAFSSSVKQETPSSVAAHSPSTKTSTAPAPPPPPVPPMSIFEDETRPNPNSQALITKLKQELNMGTEITKNLKKVSDDQKTHKNASLRVSSAVPDVIKKTPVAEKKQSSASVPSDKPPKFELLDKKWSIVSIHIALKYENN
jgi:adenylyl cyclase-associated protein